VRLDAGGVLDPEPLLTWLIAGLRRGAATADLAWGFHDWVARCVLAWAGQARASAGVRVVGLSGGVFANDLLTRRCRTLLSEAGYGVLTHTLIPAGDGGLALGQAVVAAAHTRSGWPA
jgi:hydrogenase maturation protein HypF